MLTQRRVLIALLGLIILGFFIATLANLDSVSRVFAADPSTLWGWGENGAGQLGDGPEAASLSRLGVRISGFP